MTEHDIVTPPQRQSRASKVNPMENRSHSALIAQPLLYASLALAAVAPIIAFAVLFPLVENMPRWDSWHLIPLWDAYYGGRDFVPYLLEPYNGHLNLLPRVIFFGLGLMTHWNARVEVVVSFLLATATLGVIVLMLRETRRDLLILAAPAAAAVFSFVQFENYLSGYPLGQVVQQFASTVAVYALCRRRLRIRDLLIAVVASAAAAFSFGTGLAMWPLGFLILVFRRERRVIAWVTWIVGAAIVVGINMMTIGSARPPIRLRPISLFLIVLLGKPVVSNPFPSLRTAAVAGMIVVLLAIALVLVVYRKNPDAAVRWGSFGLMGVSGASLIAMGRYGAGDRQALVSHYVTATYPLVIMIVVLTAELILANERLSRTSRQFLLLVFIGLSLAQAVIPSVRLVPTLQTWAVINRADEAALLNGTATDLNIIRTFHPNVSLVSRGIKVLQRNQLAIFANPKWRSARIGSAAPTYTAKARVTGIGPLRVRWLSYHLPAVVGPEWTVPASVTVVNNSAFTWPQGVPKTGQGARLRYRWIGGPAPQKTSANQIAPLTIDVDPNETATLAFDLKMPDRAGDYQLEVVLVASDGAGTLRQSNPFDIRVTVPAVSE